MYVNKNKYPLRYDLREWTTVQKLFNWNPVDKKELTTTTTTASVCNVRLEHRVDANR